MVRWSGTPRLGAARALHGEGEAAEGRGKRAFWALFQRSRARTRGTTTSLTCNV